MKASKTKIAVIPGDGIGPEVVREAVRVIERVRETHSFELELTHFDWGAEKFLREGVSLPAGALEMLTSEFSAILAGA
ncbi:MAG: 3-isopropylmalate dehydrogenase, partial [Acidobacteria bacterium]|nr:3-isopropylmalate dehydrogenase [Acidobacteriota bacterium]